MRALLEYTRELRPDRPAARTHRAAIRGIEAGVAAYEAYADALAAAAAGNVRELRRASALMAGELVTQESYLTQWVEGVERLQAAIQDG